MLKTILCVGMGSFVGGVGRYLLSKLMQELCPGAFPAGTLLVNVLGCFVIGLFYGLFEAGHLLSPSLRLFLTVGLCGGFTTFSTFMNESGGLLKDGNLLLLGLYMGASLVLGFAMLYAGKSCVG